jgi:hypothetical protein
VSSPHDWIAHLTLAFTTAPPLKGLTWPRRLTRRSIMQKVRRHPFPLRGIGLRPLVGTWFQVLLTPLDGVLFTFQSPYWFTIGRWRVLSLGRWSSLIHAGFHEHRATLGHRTEGPHRSPTGLSPCVADLSRSFGLTDLYRLRMSGPSTPARRLVWADPLSLAATSGVAFAFFSSGY